MKDDLLITVGQAAFLLGCCTATVRAYDERGFLTSEETRPGKHRRYKVSDVRKLKAFLAEIGQK